MCGQRRYEGRDCACLLTLFRSPVHHIFKLRQTENLKWQQNVYDMLLKRDNIKGRGTMCRRDHSANDQTRDVCEEFVVWKAFLDNFAHLNKLMKGNIHDQRCRIHAKEFLKSTCKLFSPFSETPYKAKERHKFKCNTILKMLLSKL